MTPFAVFDLDDTLVDYGGAIDAAFVALADERGIGQEGLAFLRAEQERPGPPEESWQAIAERFGFPESSAELTLAFARRLPALCRPHAGAIDGLRTLRAAGWRTALLTNGDELDQRAKLGAGWDGLFDAYCFTNAEGVRKPDPVVFRLVAARAGTDLEGAWMVGDSLEADIAGGAAVGMNTLWISGGRDLPDGGPVPDVTVTTIAKAFPVLLRVGQGSPSGSPVL
ncbi:HAD family hydrolase [Dactylosporangium roseum]|uniref:HAD family hydrolase n=1 Tax=Dactylosporangium roseum TaxID=47989 RepID=A0ABY5ZEF7_9ACTN|nr:HAD family hydrolase [Dactylosporangium roseum]UWZ39330.1 HAD family hydrolase [Dactylosporangium roseum]